MPRTRNPYPTEFRDRIVALARTGRSVESLAREFESCAATIHGWVKQVEIDDGDRQDGLSSEEREELRHLRREVKQPRQERDILSKGCPLCLTSAPVGQN
jgi:transposase